MRWVGRASELAMGLRREGAVLRFMVFRPVTGLKPSRWTADQMLECMDAPLEDRDGFGEGVMERFEGHTLKLSSRRMIFDTAMPSKTS